MKHNTQIQCKKSLFCTPLPTGEGQGWGLLFLFVLLATACRGPEIVLPPETEQKGDTMQTGIAGFYLLCEGNMGSNKASLDYYDYATATYTRNFFAAANPDVTQSLGDVGNDLAIYGSRMYAVINCSNLIEVMDAATAKHLGQIEIPNCRYLTFSDGYGYCTSYAGPVQMGNTQIGYVAKFDTATLQVVDTCHVGFQPDGLEVVGTRLYVANSGGYLTPNYETAVSVIDLPTFRRVDEITVAPNLHRIRADRLNRLWLNSRGDYYGTPSRLYCITLSSDPSGVVADSPALSKGGGTGAGFPVIAANSNAAEYRLDSVDIPVSNFCIAGDSLYFCGTQYSYITYEDEITYGIVNVRTRELVTKTLITDGTTLVKPYGIAVHPSTRDIYITDAGNYVYPGTLYCFSPEGALRWSVRTGDIPNAIVFLSRPIAENKQWITYN